MVIIITIIIILKFNLNKYFMKYLSIIIHMILLILLIFIFNYNIKCVFILNDYYYNYTHVQKSECAHSTCAMCIAFNIMV